MFNFFFKIKIVNKLLMVFTLLAAFGMRIPAQEMPAEILWDTYGVPHITAVSGASMYYAFGWAQMNNHADLILKLYGQARGRAAEYWGEDFLVSDKQVRLFDIPGHARRNNTLQREPYRSYLEAFVRGINDFAAKHPAGITEKYRKVLPVTPDDVTGHVLRVLCLEFIAYDDLNALTETFSKGSNAMAIAPSRSASGHAMLITNPHLPWYDLFLWFEAHLNSPGFEAYGITLVGAPTLSMAFNRHLGWAFTVNTMDGADRYQLTLAGKGYRWEGRVRAFESRQEVIRVLQKDGSLKEVPADFRYSVHGPVVREEGDKAWSLRVVGLDNAGIFEQYHRMAGAADLASFESALRMLQNPMFNIIYADQSGNIFYLFNGDIPKRRTGDFAFWRGTLDGSKKKLLWSSYLGYDDLPRVLNPPAGFIQNCNDAPWVCTYPPVLDPARFPAYLAPRTMFLRPQRAVNLIRDRATVSFDQLIDIKLNTGIEAADRFLDDLLDAGVKYPDSAANGALAVLRAWDRKTDNESRGAVLFTCWMDKVTNKLFLIPWNPINPVTTPDGLKDPVQAISLLKEAARETLEKYGALDVPWGSVNRFRMNGRDLPANGGPERYGIFRTIAFQSADDKHSYAVGGDTYVAVTEFGPTVKAMVALSYGNATQPGNPHCGDQLHLLSEKKLRPALLDRKAILDQLEKKELVTLNPGK